MINKVPKFPLKMKNGVQVRNLEELKANIDLESIMRYYFSGQLIRWCKVFGMTDLPEQFESNNVKFVKSILLTLGLDGTIPESEITRYVNENFGDNTIHDLVPDLEEVTVTDDKTIKEKLSSMVDNTVNLNDYSIEVVPIRDDDGSLQKYRVCISNEKNNQYSRFAVLYEIDNEYTHELFEKDIYRKIKYNLDYLEKSAKFNCIKTSEYASMKIGDTFYFGNYEGNPIKWKVLRKDSGSLYAISVEILCNRKYDVASWNSSEIRKWLNSEFYNSTFSANEKEKILNVDSDNITLLSRDEAERLLTQEERSLGSYWWLRTPYNGSCAGMWDVTSIGNVKHTDTMWGYRSEIGIRPAINIKY